MRWWRPHVLENQESLVDIYIHSGVMRCWSLWHSNWLTHKITNSHGKLHVLIRQQERTLILPGLSHQTSDTDRHIYNDTRRRRNIGPRPHLNHYPRRGGRKGNHLLHMYAQQSTFSRETPFSILYVFREICIFHCGLCGYMLLYGFQQRIVYSMYVVKKYSLTIDFWRGKCGTMDFAGKFIPGIGNWWVNVIHRSLWTDSLSKLL